MLGARTLPPTRSREHDALALIDEGGVAVLHDDSARAFVVFGHALYEGLVLGVRAMVARAVEVRIDRLPDGDRERIALADEGLARCIARRPMPAALPVVALDAC